MNQILITAVAIFGFNLASALVKKEMTRMLTSVLSMYLAIVLAIVSIEPTSDGVLFVVFLSSIVILWTVIGACVVYRRHRASGINSFQDGNGLKN